MAFFRPSHKFLSFSSSIIFCRPVILIPSQKKVDVYKRQLLASIFVPMFMIAGVNPASVQVAYRMGDGITNNICPTLAYLAILLGYAQQYEPRAKPGPCIAYQLPYTLIAGGVWIVFLMIWLALGLSLIHI